MKTDSQNIKIVTVDDDPYARGEPTVYYNDKFVSPTEVFYCWLEHWEHGNVPTPNKDFYLKYKKQWDAYVRRVKWTGFRHHRGQ